MLFDLNADVRQCPPRFGLPRTIEGEGNWVDERPAPFQKNKMSAEKPRRSKHGLQITGLRADLLESFRKHVGYEGDDARDFFEKFVWWWKPLVEILKKRENKSEIPAEHLREFFSEDTFRVIRCAEELRAVPELLDEIIKREDRKSVV